MGTVPNLLGKGNGKLGENIHTWSIPAVDTCPGRSPLCERTATPGAASSSCRA